jgi:hypothetical protein
MSYTAFCTQWFTVEFGKVSFQVFQLDNSEYCLNQAQVEAIIDEDQGSLAAFVDVSKLFLAARNLRAKTLLLPDQLSVDEFEQPVRPVLLDIAILFWQQAAEKGNEAAQDFILALVQQSLWQMTIEVASDRRMLTLLGRNGSRSASSGN